MSRILGLAVLLVSITGGCSGTGHKQSIKLVNCRSCKIETLSGDNLAERQEETTVEALRNALQNAKVVP